MTETRRRHTMLVLGSLVAVFAIAVVAVRWLTLARDAVDYCVIAAPPEARERGAHAEYSIVPGRWTCVYSDWGSSGPELRVQMSVDVFGGTLRVEDPIIGGRK